MWRIGVRNSQFELDEKVWMLIWKNLLDLFGNDFSYEDIDALMTCLLSPMERIAIAKRIMICILTLNGWNVKDICKYLKLSKTTVYKHQQFMELNPKYAKQIREFTSKLEILPYIEMNKDEESNKIEVLNSMSKLFNRRGSH